MMSNLSKIVASLPKALSTSMEGLKRSENTLVAAAKSLNDTLVAAQNSLAAANGRGEVIPTDSLAPAIRGGTGDVVTPLVDILAAKTAYNANLKVMKVTGDIERDLMVK
jgi:hypothetical protein